MGKCKFDVSRELQCGMDTEGTLCPLHALDEISISKVNELKDYIDVSPGLHNGVLYLTYRAFRDLNWVIFLGSYHNEVHFSGSIFTDCRFRNVTFHGPAHFVDSRFVKTGFDTVAFHADANFSLAQFDGKKTPFNNCTFKNQAWGGAGETINVLFVRTIFEGPAMPFPSCSISGRGVSFEGAVFDSHALRIRIFHSEAEAHIPQYLSISSDEINLTDISFNGHFDYTQVLKDKQFVRKVDFQRVHFSSMASAAFTEANLEKALFRYSVLDNVSFINCRWPRRGVGWIRRIVNKILKIPKDSEGIGRKFIYDEENNKSAALKLAKDEIKQWVEQEKQRLKVTGGQEDLSKNQIGKLEQRTRSKKKKQIALRLQEMYYRLIHIYVGLKRNNEAHGNFVGAGDWFYGEMECRRRAALKKKEFSLWYRAWFRFSSGAYKGISEYGENFIRPFLWLVVAYVSFSSLYLLNGFPIDSNGRTLNYDWFSTGDFVWADIEQALAFGFQAMTLRLPKYVDFMKWETWPIFVLHFMVTATLLPLFLLALRRRFRR